MPRPRALPLTALFTSLLAWCAAAVEIPEFVYETMIPGYYLGQGAEVIVNDAGESFAIGAYYEDRHTLDILVIKLGADGTPLWTVPIGEDNSAHDVVTGVALDADGDLWLAGWTSAPDFPITGDAFDASLTASEAFVLHLSAANGSILYGTFLGGDYTDRAGDLCIDDAGYLYVVGFTGSADFPTTVGAYQEEPGAPLYLFQDAFVTKLSPDGRSIVSSTRFGGFEDDRGEHVAIDAHGDVVIAGTTNADDLPLMVPIQSSPDAMFVSKLSADLDELRFSTYLGGENDDALRDMHVDDDGFVYLTGSTRSVSFPTTPGAFQETFVGEVNGCEEGFPGHPVNCTDGFLVKLATDGTGIVYGTYLGGASNDVGASVVVDGSGSAHVVGSTIAPDFLGTGNDSGAIFVVAIDASGSLLEQAMTKESVSPGTDHGIAVGPGGSVTFTGSIHIPYDIYVARVQGSPVVAVPGAVDAASGLVLGPTAPNPFTASTTLTFGISESARPVRLTIYDASGRLVRTLFDGIVNGGTHHATWDGRAADGTLAPAGAYFYRLTSRGATMTGRTLLVR